MDPHGGQLDKGVIGWQKFTGSVESQVCKH
jgi:hypothetical protein